MLTVNRVPANDTSPEMASASFVYIKPTEAIITALNEAFGGPDEWAADTMQINSTRALTYLPIIQDDRQDDYVRTEMDLTIRGLFDHLRSEAISELAQRAANPTQDDPISEEDNTDEESD